MKTLIVLFLIFLTLAVPSFAKNENLCLEISQLARGCFDVGILNVGTKNARTKDQCELVLPLLSLIRNEYAKKNITISEELFNVLANLCVELCAVAEKNRSFLSNQNLERIKSIIATTAHNVCMRSLKKQQKKDIVE